MALVALPEVLPFARRPPGLPATCSDTDLAEAVKAYLCGASEETLAGMLKVPTHAVKHWLDCREWGVLCQTLRPEVEGVLGGQMTRLASLAFVQLEDRIVKGDPVIGANGEVLTDDEGNPRFKPLKGKELSLIATQMLETRAKIKPQDPNKKDDDLTLLDLARSLKKYAEAKDISGEARRE
jgi:hypothetical protein